MALRRRIIANEALFYSSERLLPGAGAIRLFPEQNKWMRALAWMRWWHWAGLALALVLILDARL